MTCACPSDRLLGDDAVVASPSRMGDLPYERLDRRRAGGGGDRKAPLRRPLATQRARTAFGKSLLEFQNTRFKLAEVATITRVARAFIDRCILEVRRRQAGRCNRIDGEMVGHGHAAHACSMSVFGCMAATAT